MILSEGTLSIFGDLIGLSEKEGVEKFIKTTREWSSRMRKEQSNSSPGRSERPYVLGKIGGQHEEGNWFKESITRWG